MTGTVGVLAVTILQSTPALADNLIKGIAGTILYDKKCHDRRDMPLPPLYLSYALSYQQSHPREVQLELDDTERVSVT